MSHPSNIRAKGVTANKILELGPFSGSKELRSLQAKLTCTANDLDAMVSDYGVLGRIGKLLSVEEHQQLADSAALIKAVNIQIELAKEKKRRDEKSQEFKLKARQRTATDLIAKTLPLPSETAEQKLEIIRLALVLNRARLFLNFYTPPEFSQYLRDYITTPKSVSRAPNRSVERGMITHRLRRLRDEIQTELRDLISLPLEGDEVSLNLVNVLTKCTESREQTLLDEAETLRVWSQALANLPQREVVGQ